MAAILAPTQPLRPRAQDKVAMRRGVALNRAEQPFPFDQGQAVVPHHNPAAMGQARNCIEQAVAHPFIGHQPESGKGLAAAHPPAYSRTHG